jgi:hypothetical protein
LVGGIVFKASSAAAGSAGGLVYAEGSVGGGWLTSSSGTALAVLSVRSIAQGRLDLRRKAMELHGGLARFIFHPSRDAPPSPRSGRQLMRVKGVEQQTSHYSSATKKFSFIDQRL